MHPDLIERFVDASAAALALPLDPGHRPGVLRYFELAAALAAQVMAEPLGRSDEPALVFVPLAPDDLPVTAPEGRLPGAA